MMSKRICNVKMNWETYFLDPRRALGEDRFVQVCCTGWTLSLNDIQFLNEAVGSKPLIYQGAQYPLIEAYTLNYVGVPKM